MPRSVYSQSYGNPIQHQLLPPKPLGLEFAYHRGVDNDDTPFTRRVLVELTLVSFTAMLCLFLQSVVFDQIFAAVLLSGLFFLFGWRAFKSHVVAIREMGIAAISVACVCQWLPFGTVVELFVAPIATLILAREVVRHYAFVATVAPMPLEKAWRERDAVCWQTLLGCAAFLPISLGLAFPSNLAILLVTAGVAWMSLGIAFVRDPDIYLRHFCDAITSWCSYNRENHAVPGVLISPSGDCRTRLTLLVATVVLNAFAVFQLTSFTQITNVANLMGRSLSSPEPVIYVASILLSCAVFALLPIVSVLAAVCVVGTPVLGRLSLPRPSHVPADEWKEITSRIRRSSNRVEQRSLYIGRVAFDQSPMLVPTKVFQEHAHFLGDSGSGKTARGLSPLIEQIMGNGDASLMVIDLKGDSPELLQTIKHGATTARSLTGRDVPVRYFTLRDEQATFAFNPFKLACWQQLNPLQKTDVLCGALGLIYGAEYGEGYFSSANASVLYATISNFPNVGNFEELCDRVSHVVGSPKRYGLDDKSRDAGNHVKMSVTRLATIGALNVTEDCTPNGDVFDQRIDPTRLFKSPEALYFSLSATLGPGSSPEIGRFATYMLLTAATLTTREVPVYLVIDEFQRMASRNLDYLLQLARSMGVAVILANQSMEDLRSTGLTSTLETNCRYRQWFAISGWDDQERLSRASGETIDTIDSLTVSQSHGPRGITTGSSRSRQNFIAPRLTKNDVKLVSDDDRKSVVLINRGDGYAQYGGMPVVVESDFHISAEEYENRKYAPWPSKDSGSFVPANWQRPEPTVPHRGRKPDSTPLISTETITVGPKISMEDAQPSGKKRKRSRRKKNKSTAPPSCSTLAAETLVAETDPFERYLRDYPMQDPASSSNEEAE